MFYLKINPCCCLIIKASHEPLQLMLHPFCPNIVQTFDNSLFTNSDFIANFSKIVIKLNGIKPPRQPLQLWLPDQLMLQGFKIYQQKQTVTPSNKKR